MKAILEKNIKEKIPKILSVIPTMDVVVFPQMIVPLLVMDERIIKGINKSIEDTKTVLLLAAKNNNGSGEAIGIQDLYNVGTVATIMRMIKIPEGGVKILVQGICKAKVKEIFTEEESLNVAIELPENDTKANATNIKAQVNNIKALSEKMATSGQSFSPDFHIILSKMDDPAKIADFILSHLNISVEEAQDLLEKDSQEQFLEEIYLLLHKELEVAEVQEQIKNRARESINKSQKEYYLREQLKAIKKELGEDDIEDIEKFKEQIAQLSLPEDAHMEVSRQLRRLEKMSPDSMESTVTRNYIEWVLSLPWNTETEDNLDVKHAKEVLDSDHYGIENIKDRILDFISIRNLKKDSHSPILCFVGPPGTGKTSLGHSIAKSLGREYFRISLGGVKDESEIRGHRRTYVGAMPGRFVQALRKCKTRNPVIIIDELDKIGQDFRGDPSAAMLEVFDPEQNKTFYDNYLGVNFDLSKVIFIATANSLETISGPLRDRMEIIHHAGYTFEEKIEIAKRHLVEKAVIEAGLEGKDIVIDNDVIKEVVMSYTREAGVRNLARTINKLCSKVARKFVEDGKIKIVKKENVEEFLGPRLFIEDILDKQSKVGVTNGLAWTSFGGEMIKIEAALMPGNGKLLLTGQLGDVMKESAQAALSYARMHSLEFGIPSEIFEKKDLHIHVPAGAIPKDGPSAGVTMLSSILSVFTNREINAEYAMTGEINLSGDVMPIGGVKEKILAARRNKIAHVILPYKNKNDIIGLEKTLQGIDLIWVESANEVIKRVLMPKKEHGRA
ncbi:endopeptidase La [bacterium]|jgi:ATP-dependent Lon protease|nr:endopeptidase La [bacterium]